MSKSRWSQLRYVWLGLLVCFKLRTAILYDLPTSFPHEEGGMLKTAFQKKMAIDSAILVSYFARICNQSGAFYYTEEL